MIDVDSLSIAFGDVGVLEDVSISVEEGTFVALVGPNGAGKTTLLRAISGALTPDRGTVTVDGRDVHALSSRASSRHIAVVPQDTSLSFSFDVHDVVAMGRTPYRSRFSGPTLEDRAAVDRALERTAVEAFADRSIEDVSGGERQRVILARAIAQDTPVVLLDEPTASLDVNHQIETLELVSELVADGKTVVAAIHDLDLAARYCDRLAVLADGSVLESGPPETVLTADLLQDAFDATATVATNPVTDAPSVTTLPTKRSVDHPLPDRVHVVGTGSTAAGVLARLDATAVDVSFGPVADTDVAAATASDLDVELATVEPFSPLERDTVEATRTLVRESDVTVVADLHVGAGNQLLLGALADAPSLVFVDTRPFDDRNSAGAGARERYDALRDQAVEATPATICRRLADVTTDESVVDSLESDD